jgi:peptidoglycan/xylan/chitin deacetylase (PgdA/CDA1 family)
VNLAASSATLRIITTSWDDGAIEDLKIAELLLKRGLAGTFYVPINAYKGRPSLSPDDWRQLASSGLEIGGHGTSHSNLRTLHGPNLTADVAGCKARLENVIGKPVEMFCYPQGRYNRQVMNAVAAAGYVGGRNTQMLRSGLRFPRFEMPTSLQAYPHSFSTYMRNAIRGRNLPGLCAYALRFSRSRGWMELGMRLFDRVMQHGGIWHLYGHSWEIADLNLWDELEQLLDYVAGRLGALYLSNGDALKRITWQASQL